MVFCRRGEVDSLEDSPEPVIGVDAIGVASGEEASIQGDVLGGGMRASKEPVLASNGHGPDSVLHQIVVDLQMPIVEVGLELIPEAQAIADGLADG